MKKKFRSKWFRVAVEGATSDKRVIQRSWLEQCAKNFNPATYGARVWLEHLRSLLPDGPFKAYGDVLALKAEEVDVGGVKKMALFAQIEPTDDLVAMNSNRQKIYTSVEIDSSFADSKEAYLVGLAVTDSPASIGTEVLAFSAQNPEANPFSGRHYSDTSMFTEAVDAGLEFEEVEEQQESLGKKLFAKVEALLSKAKTEATQETDQRFSDVHDAVTALAEHSAEQLKTLTALSEHSAEQLETLTAQAALIAAQQEAFSALKAELEAQKAEQAKFSAMLDKIPSQHHARPPATGGDGMPATDC